MDLQNVLDVEVILLKFSRTMNGDGFKWPGAFVDANMLHRYYLTCIAYGPARDGCRVVFSVR